MLDVLFFSSRRRHTRYASDWSSDVCSSDLMFQVMIGDIRKRFPERMSVFGYYLERHINIDKDRHAPMAERMLAGLCGDDPRRWREAVETAQAALRARITLWDGVLGEIASSGRRLDGAAASH